MQGTSIKVFEFYESPPTRAQYSCVALSLEVVKTDFKLIRVMSAFGKEALSSTTTLTNRLLSWELGYFAYTLIVFRQDKARWPMSQAPGRYNNLRHFLVLATRGSPWGNDPVNVGISSWKRPPGLAFFHGYISLIRILSSTYAILKAADGSY